MKNKIKFFPIIILIALQSNSFGQLQRANRYFDLYQFAKAIPLYQKVVTKGSDEKRNEATSKIADCYRLINNPQEARSWYARAVENTAAAPINYFYLGQAWCELENYSEAKTAFEKYSELLPDNPKGSLYAGFCDWANKNKNVVSTITETKNEEALNTQWSDFSPVIYKDGIVFTSDRISDAKTDLTYKWTDNDYLDLYVSKPKYYKDYWTDMTAPKTLSNSYEQMFHDGPAVFSKDGSKVIISRTDRKNVKSSKEKIKTHVVKLFYANVETGNEPKFTPFFLNSDDYSVAHPALTTDAKSMIFSSDKPGGSGESDLYMCKWENETWTDAVNLGEKINSIGNEVFPCLVNDTILLFASDGHAGFGGLDIFISYKKGDEWSEPKNLMKPINSAYDDFGILMFNDLKTGFFSSNRPEGKGLDDIYAFRNFGIAVPQKEKAYENEKARLDTFNMAIISGYVKDKSNQQPIDQATVFILNPQNGKVKILKTNADGLYKAKVERQAEYLVKAMKPNYIADCLPWDIDSIEAGKTLNAPRDLLLDKLDLNKSFVLKNIYYDLDKYDIREDANPELNKVIKIMQENPYIIAELSSHTDSRSSFEYNNMLSTNRANAAVDYIVVNGGIIPGRLLARGYGEYRLTNKCKDGVPCTEEEHQLNRRTEFKVIAFSQPSGRGQFDPARFEDGEIINLKTLPDYFFEPCELKISDSPIEIKTAENNESNPGQVSNPIVKSTTSEKQVSTPQKVVVNNSEAKYHIVLLNETLYHISVTNNTTVEKLKELNKLSDNKIIVGQKLRIQ
jgi:outer membrane protein OmpA-like peptidoglycan-associated protein/LysM repeat protein